MMDSEQTAQLWRHGSRGVDTWNAIIHHQLMWDFLSNLFLFYAEEKGRGDANACIISAFQSLNRFKNGVFIRMKVVTELLFKRYRRMFMIPNYAAALCGMCKSMNIIAFLVVTATLNEA
jgi:hypothetical protein